MLGVGNKIYNFHGFMTFSTIVRVWYVHPYFVKKNTIKKGISYEGDGEAQMRCVHIVHMVKMYIIKRESFVK